MQILPTRACEQILARNSLGRLACFSPTKNESYVVPVAYTYHRGSIFFASASGQKLEYLTEHPAGVCLEVEEHDQEHNWLTVLATGDFSQLQPQPAVPGSPHRGPLHTIFDDGLVPYPRESVMLCELRIRKLSGRKDQWSWKADFPGLAKPPGELDESRRGRSRRRRRATPAIGGKAVGTPRL